MRAGRGFTRGVEVEVEVEERGGMAALTAGAVRVLQARGWDHRLTDHAIITSCIHEGACRRHTMWGTTNTCSSVRVKCVCDTTCSGPRVVNMLSRHSGRNVSGGPIFQIWPVSKLRIG